MTKKLGARIAAYVAAVYLGIGYTLGFFLASVIPAMNFLGVSYYALTWPAFVVYANLHIGPEPWVPSWSFTFKD